MYSLSEVKEMRMAGGNGSPKLFAIVLSDGKKILVHLGVLELNGKRYRNGLLRELMMILISLDHIFFEFECAVSRRLLRMRCAIFFLCKVNYITFNNQLN